MTIQIQRFEDAKEINDFLAAHVPKVTVISFSYDSLNMKHIMYFYDVRKNNHGKK
jgi:hypothetical protein